MQNKTFLNLFNENNERFFYREEALKNSKTELEEFLKWDTNMNNLEFAKKMMYSHELKANNQVEGYLDEIDLIKDVIKSKFKNIKSAEAIQRILNLYYGYFYIIHNHEINEESLHELYKILSYGLLEEYDLKNMGKLYREAPVYIFQNGRMETILQEGLNYNDIEKYITMYFDFIDNYSCDSDVDQYIKSQIMHFYFVFIHPYFDVNGRTSRTMSMWYLLEKKVYPYIIFNRGISFKGAKYDNRIKEAKLKRDLTYFLEMMLDTLKIELEKEHIMEEIKDNTTYKLNAQNYQSLLYFLTINGFKSLAGFQSIYNRYNDKKKIKEIYHEMIEPLIDMDILKVVRFTKKSYGNISNMELELNPVKYTNDENYLKRIKLK